MCPVLDLAKHLLVSLKQLPRVPHCVVRLSGVKQLVVAGMTDQN